MMGRAVLLLSVLGASLACASQPQGPTAEARESAVDSARVLEDLRYLSSPALGGRATGTSGNQMARAYIEAALREAGAVPVSGTGLAHTFALSGGPGGTPALGTNIVAMVRGSERPDRYIVVTAHYDHLGTRENAIFHGADDNASGTAALLEIARSLAVDPPENSVLFAALDAEELGLQGARAFVADPPVPVDAISLNVNMDMVGRNDAGELYFAGTFHYPYLEPLVDEVATESTLRLLKGHDRPGGSAGDDWTALSDHAAFHAAGIPFLYLGVEDHADYHRPTDTFERIQPGFYIEAVRTALALVQLADDRLEQIEAAAGR